MRFTIIIPVYNRETYIKRTLSSVVAQTYTGGIDVLIVDNNSTDGSMETAQRFAEASSRSDISFKFLSEARQGASSARNCGLDNATTPWVMFFDSDDTMSPELVEMYIRKIEEPGLNPDIVTTPAEYIPIEGKSRRTINHTKHPLRRHILNSYLPTMRYAVRRDFLIECGKWNPDILGWDDWELGIRMLLRNPRIAAVDCRKPLVHAYLHPDSITGDAYAPKLNLWLKAIDYAQHSINESSIPRKDYFLNLLEYKRLSLAGRCSFEFDPRGAEIARNVFENASNHPRLVALYRMLYRYVASGLPGGSHIAAHLIPFCI